MEDLLIIAGIVAFALYLKKRGTTTATIATQPDPLASTMSQALPAATSISGGSTVSGGYLTAPLGTMYGYGAGASTSSPAALSATPNPPPVGLPPPPFFGGTGGTADGQPFGGPLRVGVASVAPYRAPTVSVLPADRSLAGTRATLPAGHR